MILPMEPYITPEQCRMARALLKWRRDDLAAKALVNPRTVQAFENRAEPLKPRTRLALLQAFTAAGCLICEDGAVRLADGIEAAE